MARELVLRDGTPALIWPLLPSDRNGLREGYAQLSEQSRYRRFLASFSSLSGPLLDMLVDPAGSGLALVALVLPPDGDDRVVGVGRLTPYGDSPAADVAVTVLDDWQGRGVATALLGELVAHRPPGVNRFVTHVAGDNAPSLAMLRRLGPSATRRGGPGVLEVTVQLTVRQA